MTSPFGLHLSHGPKWNRALAITEETLGQHLCPGKDTEDTQCTCPDLVYSTRVRLRDGITFNSYIYCGCCDFLINKP